MAAISFPWHITCLESRFVGVDLAERPIAAARRTIAALGLSNIEMMAADLRTVDASFGEFDYIIAHGLYSWVPPDVRDALLAVCRARLAPQGVAFVSYNAFPGRHIRQMLREMMLHHTRHCRDAQERIEQGRWFLEWLSKSRAVQATWRAVLDEEIPRLLEYLPGNLAHDDLGEINDSFYLHEFAAHAAAHGLQYLGDASNQQVFDGARRFNLAQGRCRRARAIHRFPPAPRVRRNVAVPAAKWRSTARFIPSYSTL